MDDFDSFSEVLGRLRSKSRDPLSPRISSVTAAITDVMKDGDEITPGKVYASTVTTLEGMLQQEDIMDTEDALLNTLYTQAALLKILAVVVPHVAPTTLQATIGLTSRVLRALVASTLSLYDENDDNPDGAAMLGTKDGLGATNTVLIQACGAVGEVLRQLPNTTDDGLVRQLLNSTLMPLVQDSSRPKVQTAAKDALSGLLMGGGGSCHPTILQSTTKYTNAMIDRFQKHHQHSSSSSSHQQSASQNMIELMGFLNPTLAAMDFTTIGGRIMTILVDMLNLESSSTTSAARPVFVATKSRASTLHVLTINAILSTILSLLESTSEEGAYLDDTGAAEKMRQDTENKLDAFATRVLASLVQAKSTLVFREGAADVDLLESGRLIYGQVMLSASQRLLRAEGTGNREIGAKLLPLVFQQLLGLSRPIEQEEVESAICETLFVEVSQLIRTDLLKLKEATTTLHANSARECLRVLKAVVDPPFDESYCPVLKPLALLLQQMDMGDNVVTETIVTMIQLRCSPSLREGSRRVMDDSLISLVEGIGVEAFWCAINFTALCIPGKKDAVPNKYSWIFDVMKGSVIGNSQTHLAFFQDEVLPLARKFDAMFAKNGGAKGTIFRTRVINLWGLLPVFCRFPADVEASFPNLAPILVKAMNDERYPEFVAIVCNGLDVLAHGVLERKNDFQELIDGDEAASVRKEAETLGRLSVKILPSLFKLVDSLHESKAISEDGDAIESDTSGVNDDACRVVAVTQAIASIARLAPKPQIQNLFAKVVQRMLQTSQSEDKRMVGKMCSLLALAQALVVSECLEEASIDLLYRALKPLIRTDETPPKIQKRAYKLLCEICKQHHAFIAKPDRLKEILELLSTTSATSQIAARFMRLKCLTFVVEGLESSSPEAKDVTKSLAGETLLCLKDSNAKTREAAYKLLLAMTSVYGQPSEYMQVVAAAIASNTSHMRSASVTALGRLVFEFASEDPAVHDMLPSLIKTVLILSDDPCREVTKSMVGFVRVSVSAASVEQLEPLLPDIISGLLKYHRGKDRFRAKIKIIIKKLVKMFGYDALVPFVPESDTRLLTHMRKLSDREARRKNSRAYESREEDVGYEAMVDSDGEDDSDDGLTLVTRMTRKSRLSRVTSRSGKQTLKRRHMDSHSLAKSTRSARGDHVSIRIKNDADGEVLDVKELKTVRFAEPDSDDDGSDVEMEFDVSGKLVVHDVDDAFSTSKNHDDGDTLMSFKSRRSIQSQRSKGSRTNQGRNDDGSRKHKKSAPKVGQAYKAKKAGGDTKKKGQKDPYAYIELDVRNYSRKNRRQAVEQMGSVVQRGNKRQRR